MNSGYYYKLPFLPKFSKLLKFFFHIGMAQYYFVRFKMECYAPPLFKTVFNKTTLCSLTQGAMSKILHKLNRIYITDYIEWDIDNIAITLENELGWRYPKKPCLPMRFDCNLEGGFIDYTYKKATGLTLKAIICNNLIYGGITEPVNRNETLFLSA